MGLLLPAVNSARESARRLQCCNNLKQIALAVIAYQSAQEAFPPGTTNTNAGEIQQAKSMKPHWVILCMPQMDLGPLADEFTALLDSNGGNHYVTDDSLSVSYNGHTIIMKELRQREISFFKCPSDIFTKTHYMRSNIGWARGCYGANMGGSHITYLTNPSHAWTWNNQYFKGIMGPGLSVTMEEIVDGASNTVLIGEIRAGIDPVDPRGTWAMGGPCSSGIAGAGCGNGAGNFDDRGPNCLVANSDDVLSCGSIQSKMGGNIELIRLKMPCTGSGNDEMTMRSLHAGGVHAAFADGSAHWLSDNIQIGTGFNTFGVWDCMLISNDKKSFSGEGY